MPPPTGDGSTLTPAPARPRPAAPWRSPRPPPPRDRTPRDAAGGLAEAAHLADVLQGGLADLVVGHDLGALSQSLDAPAHARTLSRDRLRGGAASSRTRDRGGQRLRRVHIGGAIDRAARTAPARTPSTTMLGVRGQPRRPTADRRAPLRAPRRVCAGIRRMPRGATARRAARRRRHRTIARAAGGSTGPPRGGATGPARRPRAWRPRPGSRGHVRRRTPRSPGGRRCRRRSAPRRGPPSRSAPRPTTTSPAPTGEPHPSGHDGHPEGRVVRQPAEARVEHLDPGVRVGVPHVVVAGERVALPRPVPRDDPRRDPLGPQQHRHRRSDVFAEPAPGLEQEVIHRVDARRLARHGQVVPRVRLEPGSARPSRRRTRCARRR